MKKKYNIIAREIKKNISPSDWSETKWKTQNQNQKTDHNYSNKIYKKKANQNFECRRQIVQLTKTKQR